MQHELVDVTELVHCAMVLCLCVQERICAARVGATAYCGASCGELVQAGVLCVRVQDDIWAAQLAQLCTMVRVAVS